MFVSVLKASPSRRLHSRRGLTLTEVLIAVTITLILLGILIGVFKYTSGEITNGRAIIELSGQLRMTTERLRNDLKGATAPLRPWVSTADGLGYFEYFEATPHRDNPTTIDANGNPLDTTIGDIDDVLMFTARAKGRPFRGRYWIPGSTAPTVVESDFAEIIWWTRIEDRNGNGQLDTGENLVLHRRVLLIRPDLNSGTGNIWANNNFSEFFERNDISVRASYTGLAANSLGDLTRRENRFAHWIGYDYPSFPPNNAVDIQNAHIGSFPHPIDRGWLSNLKLAGSYEGEDVILSSLIAFDVKAYDPLARVYDNRVSIGAAVGTVALTPSDPGYANEVRADMANNGQLDSFISLGTYVDLGYDFTLLNGNLRQNPPFIDTEPPIAPPIQLGTTFGSHFAGVPAPRSQMATASNLPARFLPHNTYCTWSTHYENDGIDQDANFTPFGVDQGSNGLDDNQVDGTDDSTERETSPPFPHPLRGISVTIRLVEPDTQQIRQSTVIHDFIPE